MLRWKRIGLVLGFTAGLAGCGGPPHVEPPWSLQRPQLTGVDTSPVRGHRILIDPGHGGPFAGTQGVAGTREADVNLGVALALWGLLHDAGADVFLTRTSDRAVLDTSNARLRDDLAARVHAIDSLAPEVFLSLHHNSNAALDRERNAIETYYKLGDDGASYDLGRALHARLAQALGAATTELRPGNYFVLRAAHSPAVLGEASYLSNPMIESKLQLAAVQRLEAEAYFLGLIDYFAHGSAAIDKQQPTGDTLAVGTPLRFVVGEPIDPLTATVLLDDQPVALHVDAAQSLLVTREELPPGAHRVRARARLARGNAARDWIGTVVVHATPARAVLSQEPVPAAPGSCVRVRIAVQDAAGRPVGDGVPVRLVAQAATVLDADSVTVAGVVRALVRPAGLGARLRVETGAFWSDLGLRCEPGAARREVLRCVDTTTGAPVSGAWSRAATAPSDRNGWLEFAALPESLAIEAPGTRPWHGSPPEGGVVALDPVYGGRLRDVRIVLDPVGDDATTTLPGAGMSAAAAAAQACGFARDLLQAGGARCTLVVQGDDEVSDVERVRRAELEQPEWYVRLAILRGRSPGVVHYAGSAGGARLAGALSTWLERRRGRSVPVSADTRFILQQTPCPAAVVELPADAGNTTRAARETGYALFLALRAVLDPETAERPPLVATIAPAPPREGLASLDGAEVVPLGPGGTARFECVAVGRHVLRVLEPGGAQLDVEVAGADTTRVRIAPTPP